MGTGLSFLAAGLAIAVLAVILWLTYSRLRDSSVQRREELRLRTVAHQPWDNDKSGGRGNR
jgi:hypothetical protein